MSESAQLADFLSYLSRFYFLLILMISSYFYTYCNQELDRIAVETELTTQHER